jgi:hypothetical protein
VDTLAVTGRADLTDAQWAVLNGVSGQPRDAYLLSWVHTEGLHAGQEILGELNARFDCQASIVYGPYFFADLAATGDADEQAPIDNGLIPANRIQYAGRRKKPSASTLRVNGAFPACLLLTDRN